MAKPNPWDEVFNAFNASMRLRMEKGVCFPFTKAVLLQPLPYHKRFFEEHSFGACVGISDYLGLVILLEDCIESIRELKVW